MSDEYDDDFDDDFDDLDEMLIRVSTTFQSGREYIHNTLGVAYAILVRTSRDQQMQALLKERYTAAGRKDQKNTDDAARVVKLTITENRQAAQPYTRVLRKALKEMVKVSEFGKWVDDNGIYPKKIAAEDPAKNDKALAKREIDWDSGYDKVGAMPVIGAVELPEGLPAENVMAVLVYRKVSGDRQAKIVKVFSGDEDEFLGPLIRKYGRQKQG
jgi:hypothetical protein